ncbi:hypothetical protein [Persephonella sp.]
MRRAWLFVLLVIFQFAFALEYKTGYQTQSVISFKGYWDGTRWNVEVRRLNVARNPSTGIVVDGEVLLRQTGYAGLPNPPAAPATEISKDSIYADALNAVLPTIAQSTLTQYQESSEDRVSVDLEIKGTDGETTHFVASYDGENGYRAYGFQQSAPNLAFFTYYSASVDIGELPPPPNPDWASDDYENNMGKYDEIIISPDGSIVYQVLSVDVAGKYDPPPDGNQDEGLNLFIEEVVKPEMENWNVSLATIQYYYNIRILTDDEGNYAYTVDIPYRETKACDEYGEWNDERKRCEYNLQTAGATGTLLGFVDKYIPQFYRNLLSNYITIMRSDYTFSTLFNYSRSLGLVSTLLQKTYNSVSYKYLYCYNRFSCYSYEAGTLSISSGTRTYIGGTYIGNTYFKFYIKESGGGVYLDAVSSSGFTSSEYLSPYYDRAGLYRATVSCYCSSFTARPQCSIPEGAYLEYFVSYNSLTFPSCWSGWTRFNQDLIYGMPISCPTGYTYDSQNNVCYKSGQFEYLKETVRYNYETVADYKTVMVDQYGNSITVAIGQIQGSQYSYSYEKQVDFPAIKDGISYTPTSITELSPLIIDFRDNSFNLIEYWEAGLTADMVAPITVVK